MISMTDISSIKKLISKRKKQLKGSLTKILEQLKKEGVLKVILFGSLREGNIDINSDIDLLLIMPNTKPTKKWISYIYDNIERNIASDLIVYNKEDFDKMLPNRRFLNHILKTGKVLYEKN